jgi:uncharacterized protein with gpF-like domain
MTEQEKHNYLIRFQRFQQRSEILYAPQINRALGDQYKTFIAHVHKDGLSAVNKISADGIFKVLTDLYNTCATTYAAKIRADIVKFKKVETKAHAMGFSQRMHELIKQYFGVDILNTSEGITQTTRELITEVFTNAYAQGLSINDMIQQFEGTELSRMRARLIARTETVAAANTGAFLQAKESGLKLNKVWLSVKDKRTRPDHVTSDGQQVGKEDYFNIGGYDMLFPGDKGGKDGKPDVPGSEVINCRCTHIYQPVRDTNGRLVREG